MSNPPKRKGPELEWWVEQAEGMPNPGGWDMISIHCTREEAERCARERATKFQRVNRVVEIVRWPILLFVP